MNKCIVVCGLLISMVGSAHAWFGLPPSKRSIERRALAAGHDPVTANQLAHTIVQEIGNRSLNRTGVAATINTGNIFKGLEATHRTRGY